MSVSAIGISIQQQHISPQAQQFQAPQPVTDGQAAEAAGGQVRSQASSDPATARNQLNLQILQASAQVSLQSGDQSQSLLLQAAIDRINELLAPDLGPDALQAKQSEDNSPEATAQRILSLSTGFFDAYAANHPGEDPGQVARNFVDLIRGGFEKGFNEARDILKGLKVFDGDVQAGVMRTFELVSQGYDDFLAGKLAKSTDAAGEASEQGA